MNLASVQERVVHAAVVFDEELVFCQDDPRVAPGDLNLGENDLALVGATDERLAVMEPYLTLTDTQPVPAGGTFAQALFRRFEPKRSKPITRQ